MTFFLASYQANWIASLNQHVPTKTRQPLDGLGDRFEFYVACYGCLDINKQCGRVPRLLRTWATLIWGSHGSFWSCWGKNQKKNPTARTRAKLEVFRKGTADNYWFFLRFIFRSMIYKEQKNFWKLKRKMTFFNAGKNSWKFKVQGKNSEVEYCQEKPQNAGKKSGLSEKDTKAGKNSKKKKFWVLENFSENSPTSEGNPEYQGKFLER